MQKPQQDKETYKRIILGKEAFIKNNELLWENMILSLKKTADKDLNMERSIIRIRDVDSAERILKKFGSI